MEVLSNLEEYSELTDDANKSIKSSFWHLTKSRKRYQGGFLASVDSSYSAAELREEFSALSVLEIVEPSLLEEDGMGGNSDTNAAEWRLVDVAKARDRDGPNTTQQHNETGLRQRGQKGKQTSTKPSMQEEDTKIIDPLSLFGGLTPQDLKKAQKSAKEALEKYVEAANKVARIQGLIAKNDRSK